MANALPSLSAGQCAAVPASNLTLSDESAEDSFYVHSSAECTDPSSLLDELVCHPCPIACKETSSVDMSIQNQLNSNDLECYKKYPNVMDHSYVGVCVENHTPPIHQRTEVRHAKQESSTLINQTTEKEAGGWDQEPGHQLRWC